VKVLIADDDRVLTRLVSARLKAKGWQVEVVHDSTQALMFAMRSQPDVIVLDISMPGGSGLEVLTKLQRSTRTEQIPVLVVTGSITPAVEQRVMELGAAAFLHKPVDPETLHATLSRLAGR
jgi:DNA-binding response OmpR family regulator